MKRTLAIMASTCLLAAPAFAEPHEGMKKDGDHSKKAHAEWGYHGEGKASNWGDTAAVCLSGQEQSPINIDEYVEDANLAAITTSYEDATLTVVNNGHTVQVNYPSGSKLMVGDATYELLQFHFHTPSEHYVDGAPYPMEVHFVHKAADGTLGVVGAMMKIGEKNPVIEGIWQNVPAAGETKEVSSIAYNAKDLWPSDLSYYKYEGSLTTPPCSEGVQWHVLKEPIEISEAQLVAFQNIFPVNARPVQPIGARSVKGN